MADKGKNRIMMVTMSMGLGGAETHIMELARALMADGYQVSICSYGGIYADMLAKEGCPHYQAPLHRRHPFVMLQAFWRLGQAIRRERPDIIHAHARIPAFLSSIWCKAYRIPLVTTTHFPFSVAGPERLLSKWGEYSLAVSEDLKRYLITQYHMPENRVFVTVNGINLQTFRADLDAGRIEREFHLKPQNRIIVSVSRLDEGACRAAEQLLACAPRLFAVDSSLRILIVGSGNKQAALAGEAAKINKQTVAGFITFTGGRSDIAAICARADIFVGVSRAALEAMACETPVILAGDAGYLGIFDPQKLPACEKTNFTCRGYQDPDPQALYRDLQVLLAMPAARRQELGAYGRQIVGTKYSLRRMREDAEKMYRAVLALPKYQQKEPKR